MKLRDDSLCQSELLPRTTGAKAVPGTAAQSHCGECAAQGHEGSGQPVVWVALRLGISASVELNNGVVQGTRAAGHVPVMRLWGDESPTIVRYGCMILLALTCDGNGRGWWLLGWAGRWQALSGRRASLKSSMYSCWLREKLMVVTPTMGGELPSSPSMCFCMYGLGDESDEFEGANDCAVAPGPKRLAADICPHVPPPCPKGLRDVLGEIVLLLTVDGIMVGGICVPM